MTFPALDAAQSQCPCRFVCSEGSVLSGSNVDFFQSHRLSALFFDDYTDKMQAYIDNWKKLDLQFNGIQTGFLGSERQIAIVQKFLEDFCTAHTTVVIDPVMGDHGSMYPTYTEGMCQSMKKLVAYADILTPNLTEACILTDTPFHEGHWTMKELDVLARKLAEPGAGKDCHYRHSAKGICLQSDL